MSEELELKPSIENTAELSQLFSVDRKNRDEAWSDSFFAALPLAALRTREERVFNGPDGFLYFGLFMPKEEETYNAVSFEEALEFCTKEGIGIAIFSADSDQPEWVFNYGSVWNYKVHQNFYDNPFANPPFEDKNSDKKEDESKNSESILVASPSEEYLPLPVRAVILRDLQQQNVTEPAVLMMTVDDEGSYLVFNAFAEDFEEQHFEFIQQYLVWVLPQGYSIATVAADSELNEHFISLQEMLESPIN